MWTLFTIFPALKGLKCTIHAIPALTFLHSDKENIAALVFLFRFSKDSGNDTDGFSFGGWSLCGVTRWLETPAMEQGNERETPARERLRRVKARIRSFDAMIMLRLILSNIIIRETLILVYPILFFRKARLPRWIDGQIRTLHHFCPADAKVFFRGIFPPSEADEFKTGRLPEQPALALLRGCEAEKTWGIHIVQAVKCYEMHCKGAVYQWTVS